MVFSSITFLFYFLPIVLLFYFLVPKKAKNFVLLLASMFFYFYGEPKYIVVLVLSCLINYYFGKWVENSVGKRKKVLLILSLIINFGMLFYFKYFDFVIININHVFSTEIDLIKVIMPIGISFFTFQATSYVIDIYRSTVKSAKNIWSFATYLSLFPQLIAGPIVRYETVAEELENRNESTKDFSQGVKRFIIGLAKKILIANVIGELVSILSSLVAKTVLSHILGAVSITLQLYFDFSGYSDMAIGLGLMFGFHFLENFNYPLIARSITDFWRRWHISLSSWLKDYIYIPLGGSRGSKIFNYRNILLVWLATGLWHGAAWNFILWGLYFGVILLIEKQFLLKFLNKHKIISHIYTLLLIVISFVIFHHENIQEGFLFIQNMFGFGNLPFTSSMTFYYIRSYGVVILLSLICMTPLSRIIRDKIEQNKKLTIIKNILEPFIYLLLLTLITAYIVDESFNPFLYFRF